MLKNSLSFSLVGFKIMYFFAGVFSKWKVSFQRERPVAAHRLLAAGLHREDVSGQRAHAARAVPALILRHPDVLCLF